MDVFLVGTRPLKVGDGFRQPGEPVPEAPTWPTRGRMVSRGELVQLSAAVAEKFAPELQAAYEAEVERLQRELAELAEAEHRYRLRCEELEPVVERLQAKALKPDTEPDEVERLRESEARALVELDRLKAEHKAEIAALKAERKARPEPVTTADDEAPSADTQVEPGPSEVAPPADTQVETKADTPASKRKRGKKR